MIPAMQEYRVTSPFGWRTSPINGKREFHTGIDLVKAHNGPIYAFVAGEVIHAKEGVTGSGFGGYGIVIAIRDPATGHLHCYAHLDSVAVKVGDKVKLGQLIGRQGSTGQSTGSHLHYEIRKTSSPQFGWIADRENNCFDPVKYLDESYGKEQNISSPVNKPVDKHADALTKEALKVLQSEQVIQTPEYWLQNAYAGGTVRGDYAALLIQNMAKKLSAAPQQPESSKPEQPKPEPEPKPKPPAKLDWPEVEKRAAQASVAITYGAAGVGSGTLLPDGYVLTAKHVGNGASKITVRTKEHGSHSAHLIAVHPGFTSADGKLINVDVALYRVPDTKAQNSLPSVPIAVIGVETGQKLLAVVHGDKYGTVKRGDVDRPTINTSSPPTPFEFDCSVGSVSGDSGGGLVNQYGQVVGVIIQRTSVNAKIGSVWQRVSGCEAVNVAHPVLAEWLREYL